MATIQHYQSFSTSSIPTGYAEIGGGTWVYNSSTATQSVVSASDPQKVLYTQELFNVNRIVQAKVTFNSVDATGSNDRSGISVLSNSSTGNGVNLFWNSNAGGQLRFLNDGVEWNGGVAMVISATQTYFFKAMCLNGTFSGKAWLTTAAEPTAWQLTYTPASFVSTWLYSGLGGNVSSQVTKASFDDLYISDFTTLTINKLRPRIFAPGIAR